MTTIRRARIDDAPLLRELTKSSIAREADRHLEDRSASPRPGLVSRRGTASARCTRTC
jgi:hypothetical protein